MRCQSCDCDSARGGSSCSPRSCPPPSWDHFPSLPQLDGTAWHAVAIGVGVAVAGVPSRCCMDPLVGYPPRRCPPAPAGRRPCVPVVQGDRPSSHSLAE